jgi:hypothetical protein
MLQLIQRLPSREGLALLLRLLSQPGNKQLVYEVTEQEEMAPLVLETLTRALLCSQAVDLASIEGARLAAMAWLELSDSSGNHVPAALVNPTLLAAACMWLERPATVFVRHLQRTLLQALSHFSDEYACVMLGEPRIVAALQHWASSPKLTCSVCRHASQTALQHMGLARSVLPCDSFTPLVPQGTFVDSGAALEALQQLTFPTLTFNLFTE